MENKYSNVCLNTSNLLINSGWLLTLLRLVNIISTPWQAIFQYWLALTVLFMVELAALGLAGGVKWLWDRVAK